MFLASRPVLLVIAVLLAFVIVGLILMPAQAVFLLIGVLTALAGLVALMVSPAYGGVLIGAGALMIVIGLILRARAQREDAQAAERTIRQVRRSMDVYIPPDDSQ